MQGDKDVLSPRVTRPVTYPQVGKGPVVHGQLCHATPVPVRQGLWRAVATAQRVLLRQQPLQLRGRPACYQRPDQGEDIIIEVCLKGWRWRGCESLSNRQQSHNWTFSKCPAGTNGAI